MKALAITASAVILLSACTSPGKQGSMNKSDPQYELSAECGGRLNVFIIGDSTLQQRIKLKENHSAVPEYLVKSSIETHPAIGYLRLLEDRVGTAKILSTTKNLAPEVAGLNAAAQKRFNNDKILANKEVIPFLLENASQSCKRAGFNFTELRSMALEITAESSLEEKKDSDNNFNKITKQNYEVEKANVEAREKVLLTELMDKIRSSIKPATAHEKRSMATAIERTLIDPDSAKYRDSYVIPNGSACIEVNSKNRMGGYAGFRMTILSRLKEGWISLDAGQINAYQCIEIITKIDAQNLLKTSIK